jgi:hypothetical protein
MVGNTLCDGQLMRSQFSEEKLELELELELRLASPDASIFLSEQIHAL